MKFKELYELKLHYSLDYFFSEEVPLKNYGKFNNKLKVVKRYNSSLNLVEAPMKPISKFIDPDEI